MNKGTFYESFTHWNEKETAFSPVTPPYQWRAHNGGGGVRGMEGAFSTLPSYYTRES